MIGILLNTEGIHEEKCSYSVVCKASARKFRTVSTVGKHEGEHYRTLVHVEV